MGWKRKTKGLNKRFKEIRFERETGSDFVSITYDGANWNVWNGDAFDDGGIQLNKKPLNSKSKAILFAGRWMRKHPNG